MRRCNSVQNQPPDFNFDRVARGQFVLALADGLSELDTDDTNALLRHLDDYIARAAAGSLSGPTHQQTRKALETLRNDLTIALKMVDAAR